MATVLSLGICITTDSYVVLLLHNVTIVKKVGIIVTGYNMFTCTEGIDNEYSIAQNFGRGKHWQIFS